MLAGARLIVLAALLVAPAAVHAQDTLLGAARYRPDLQFRTMTSGRFDIHFHQGEEALAARLVRIIEDAAPAVERRYGTPRRRVHVILVDQTDVANGWATVIPYNLIEIAAAPPQSRSTIGHTDDWLRLVFTHEYTHILHLEKSRGWFGGLRRIFGRLPAFYPNLFLPDWQIEGLATQMESAVTGHGRVKAGDFRMILDRAAAAGRFAPLDRATGAVIDWPGGMSAYLYGAYFHEYLALRFGQQALDRLADETAGRLPFTGSLAYREVFGESLGSLWKAFESDVRSRAADAARADRRTRLTTHGFTVSTPAFAPDGRLFYSVANPHGFPSLMELRDRRPPRVVAPRFLGEALSISGNTAVYDQLEFSANVGLVSDLYVLRLDSGAVRRLTRGARAADPHISPDGRTIVCTVQQTGRRILATFDFSAGSAVIEPRPFLEQDATEFSSPRWSPDGRSIVAERRPLHGLSEIVIVDVATRAVRTIVAGAPARNITPSWADGDTVLFSSDREGGPFTLHALHVPSGVVRRLTDAGAGVQWPVVAPDGDRVVFVGYSADGYDLFSISSDNAAWTPIGPDEGRRLPAGSSQPTSSIAVPGSRAYSPLDTLLPRFWIPYFEADGEDVVIGAGTGGFDALGRHSYALTAGLAVPRNRLDLQLAYSYTRWRPALFAALSDDTDAWREGYIRTRELSAGVLFPVRRVRWGTSVLVAATRSTDDFEVISPAFSPRPSRDRTSARLGWSFSTARAFGYSISAEEGASISLVSEFARGGSDVARGTARTFVGEGRIFQAVWPRHAVIAGRVAGATSRGDRGIRRDFGAGGSGPQYGGFDVGVDAIGLLRGFDSADVFGRSAAVLNVDYRIPLVWPQRGIGTLPVFLRAVHAALFVDAGHAWDDRFRAADVRRSAGAELSFDTVLVSWLPITITTGAAWRHDPVRARDAAAVFARIGRAF